MSERIKIVLAGVLLMTILSDCSVMKVPQPYLPTARQAGRSVTGSWMILKVTDEMNRNLIFDLSGELIAITTDTVYVLTEAGLQSLRSRSIASARIYLYARPSQSKYGWLALTPGIGGLFTEFPGGFFIVNAPLFIYSTFLAVIEAGSNSVIRYPGDADLKSLYIYSRFPQGLPHGIDRAGLRLKPAVSQKDEL